MTWGRARRVVLAVVLAAGFAAAFLGCEIQWIEVDLVGPEDDADAGCDAGDAGDDCADGGDGSDGGDSGDGDDSSTKGATCTGRCTPLESEDGWTRPTLVWFGPADATPSACPASAPLHVLDAFTDLGPLSHTCPVCTCAETCSPPFEWSMLAATCAEANKGPVESTPWDAPANWDGACLLEPPMSDSELCMNGAPCGGAVVVAPPAHECMPLTQGVEEKEGPPWPWETQARICFGDGDIYADACPPENTCVPLLPEPTQASEGRWATCIWRHGEQTCPPIYKEQAIVFTNADDQRGCSPCACTGPDGGACEVTARAVTDATCGKAALSADLTSEKQTDYCFDLPAGADLTGKSASITHFIPGACTPSGSEATGSVTLLDPVTLCCLPLE